MVDNTGVHKQQWPRKHRAEMPDGRWSCSCGVSQTIVNSNKEQYVALVVSQKNCQQHTGCCTELWQHADAAFYGCVPSTKTGPKLDLAAEGTEHTPQNTHTHTSAT